MENNNLHLIEYLKDDIENVNINISYLKNIIYKMEKDIKEKYKIMHEICNHEWEQKRENHMYGEKYEECTKCGMCK